MATPEPWGGLRARVATLIASRDAALDETARAWARFARGQGWSRADVEGLWEGLTEDVVRGYARGPALGSAEARGEVLAVMAALRGRILDGLEPRTADRHDGA